MAIEPGDTIEQERETLRDKIAYAQYATMELIATRWPERAGRATFDLYTRAMHAGLPKLRGTVAANLSRVLGKPPGSDVVQAAVREAFSLYGRYWYDTFRLQAMPPSEITKRFVMEDVENLDRGLEQGRGAITTLPHVGNWDAAGNYMAASGYRICAVAEHLRPRRVFEQFLRHRKALGMHIVPLTSDRQAGLELARLLSEGWVVALVADRDLGRRGVEVEMFGATRRLPAGPALLSLRTGAPLFACSVYTTDDGWVCRIGEPIEIEPTGNTRADVNALTRQLAERFERIIAAKPVDWHMFQPAWD